MISAAVIWVGLFLFTFVLGGSLDRNSPEGEDGVGGRGVAAVMVVASLIYLALALITFTWEGFRLMGAAVGA